MYNMLNKEEFLRLQKLAALSLDDTETAKLGKQLWTIVDFLGKLQEISWKSSWNISNYHTLKPISGVSNYDDTQKLFENVTHEKIGKSIVVNSVVDN